VSSHDFDQDHLLVGAYVLDALPPDERAAFEAHLRICADCRAEVAELGPVVDALPLASPTVEPPQALRGRIVAAVAADVPSPPRLSSVAGGRTGDRTRFSSFLAPAILATAAAVIIAVLGLWNIQLQRGLHDNQQKVAYQQTLITAVLQGASVRTIAATSVARAAQAAMVAPRGKSPAYLLVQGLPVTPPNKVYQLWLIHGSTPHSGGVFRYSGSDPQIVRVPIPLSGYGAAAVTTEPGPHGSRQPTGAKLLLGRLTA